MSRSNFWNRKNVSLQDVPTLQELLRCCDKNLLIRVLMDDHLVRIERRVPDSALRRTMEQRLSDAVETMRTIEVSLNENKLLVAQETFSVVMPARQIARHVSAALMPLKGVSAVRRARKALGKHAVKSLSGVRKAEKRLRALPVCPQDEQLWPSDEWPEGEAFSFEPWEAILGVRVWLGGPWCCRERYMVLASIVWEMTYFGLGFNQGFAECQGKKTAVDSADEECFEAPPFEGASSEANEVLAYEYGLIEPDRFENRYRKKLARRSAVLNAKARRQFYDRLLALLDKRDK